MSKTVIVTGASKGIGASIARVFAKEKYNVCINYNRSKEKAEELKDELEKEGCSVLVYKADVSKREEVEAMVEHVLSTFHSIDVLVNNAGICEYKLFTDLVEEDIQKMFNTSVIGTFNTTQSVLKKYMLHEKKGRIINISSIWGMVGASMEVNYSTSKAAIIGMSKALAKELALSNITVNVVAPGAIDTDMNSKFSKEELDAFCEEIPLGRMGKVEEVANVVKFLASEEASYITGQVISPNGGIVT